MIQDTKHIRRLVLQTHNEPPKEGRKLLELCGCILLHNREVLSLTDWSIGKSNGLFHRLLLEFAHKKYAQSEQHDGETTWVIFRRQQDKIS